MKAWHSLLPSLAVLASLTTAHTVHAQSDARHAAPPATVDELLARLRYLLDSSGTPGASLALVRGDSVLFAGALGLARITPAQRATERTRFRIGSSSKMLIGLTALALEREGRFSLQQTADEALPTIRIRNRWNATHPIRLVHLIEHTSGLDDNSLKAYASSDPSPLSLADGLAIDAGRLEARWRPGSRFAYTNTGPALVALAIEQVEGKPFEQIVAERWFGPLGSRTATYFEPTDEAAPLASLYIPGRDQPIPYWHPFARPIGALNATAPDMAALLRLLTLRGVVGGDTLLPPALMERAEHGSSWVGIDLGITEVGYGLGLYRVEGDDGRIWAGHSGAVEGGLSDVSYLPNDGVGYSLQINAMRGRALALMSAQVRAFLTRALPAPVAPPAAPLSPIVSRDFTGWYRPVSPRPQLQAPVERLLWLARLHTHEGVLEIRPLLEEAVRYVPVDSLRFRTENGVVASLALHHSDADGGRAMMEGFNTGKTYERLAAWDVFFTFGGTGAWLLALGLGPLVAIATLPLGGVRRWRQRRGVVVTPRTPTALATSRAWWCAAIGSVAVVTFCWSVLTGFQDVRRFGSVSALSVLAAITPFVYVLSTSLGLWFVRGTRGRVALGREAIARWGARLVLFAHVIGLVYSARYGLIGYIPWR